MIAHNAIDWTGKTVNQLSVLSPDPDRRGYWLCKCSCSPVYQETAAFIAALNHRTRSQAMPKKLKPPLKVTLHFWSRPRYTINGRPIGSLADARELARKRGHDGIRVVFLKPKGAKP